MKIKEITEQRVDEALPAVAAIWVLRWVIAKGAWPFLKWVLRKFGTKLATGAAAVAAIDQGWEWVKGQIGEEMAQMLIENKFEIGMAVALILGGVVIKRYFEKVGDRMWNKVDEGKSPHKKGTAKYKKHMAAMHAESEYKHADHAKGSDPMPKKSKVSRSGETKHPLRGKLVGAS